MKPATLEEHQGRLLGAPTLASVQRLGGDTVCVDADNRFRTWRMARVDDLVLIDQAADETAPRSINCYRVELEEIDASSQLAEDGKKYKVDPSRLLYALRRLDRGEPPDLDLTLVRDPATWFDHVSILLFGALNRDDPRLFEVAFSSRRHDATMPCLLWSQSDRARAAAQYVAKGHGTHEVAALQPAAREQEPRGR